MTGGAGGIGRATVDRLLRDGVAVLAADADAAALAACRAEMGERATRLRTVVVDVTRPDDVAAMVETTQATFGRIDVLVNIAGGAGPTRVHRIDEIDMAVWSHVIDLNLTSAFLCSRAVVPAMRAQRYGRIINLSSILARGEKGPPTTVAARLPYATAKAALLGFTTQLARDEAAFGITVNALLPGLILGGHGTRIRGRFEQLSAAQQEAMLRDYPIGRAGTADEVAATIGFLASEAAGYISGAHLPVDGAYL